MIYILGKILHKNNNIVSDKILREIVRNLCAIYRLAFFFAVCKMCYLLSLQFFV